MKMETINSMKTKLKAKLEEGTHVSPEVYVNLAMLSNTYTDKLINAAIAVFEKDKLYDRMNKSHVYEAHFILHQGE